MNEFLKSHIVKWFEKGKRYDGRALDEYRPVVVEYGVTKNAEGSARVKIGDTEVIAGVKLSVEKPYPDTPKDGNLMVGAEPLPLSSPDYEAGPPNEESIEVARVVDRGLRESKAIDTKKFDYRRLLEEKRREATPEELTELEKDLKVYLHEKETMDKKALEELFGEKQEEGIEE